VSHPTIPHPVAASQLKKKLSFPMRNSPKNNSPDRKYSPFRAKVEKENSNDLSIKIKEKSNPESPKDFVKKDFESISSFKQFLPNALSPQHSEGLIKAMNAISVEVIGSEPKIIKERMVVPKFIAEADKKAKDKNLLSFTPNKSKEKIGVSPFRERFQTR
jgi:stalled ribosome rescue protein Dom34